MHSFPRVQAIDEKNPEVMQMHGISTVGMNLRGAIIDSRVQNGIYGPNSPAVHDEPPQRLLSLRTHPHNHRRTRSKKQTQQSIIGMIEEEDDSQIIDEEEENEEESKLYLRDEERDISFCQ